MTKKEVSTKILLQQKLLPLYYHDSIEISISIMNALYEAGIKMIEYTNRGDAAINNFKLLRKAVDDNFDDFQLGIGTIKTPHHAHSYSASAGLPPARSLATGINHCPIILHFLISFPQPFHPTHLAKHQNNIQLCHH